MLCRACKRQIERLKTREALENMFGKLDIYLLCSRISEAEYEELAGLIQQKLDSLAA